jgi:glyoxylate reductase
LGFSVFVTRRIPEAGLELLRRESADLHISPHDRPVTRAEFLRGVAGRDGVLCHLTDRVDDELLAAAGSNCRAFANYAVGYNNIDVAAAARRGIWVTNTPGVLTETTADLAWALLMSAARRIVESDRVFRTGRWDGWGPMQFLGHDIHGATLGIIGAGRIGQAVARRAVGFGMRILYCGRGEVAEMQRLGAARLELDALLRESDFVSLHVPLTGETRHLIGRRELGLMKPSAYLINTARGPVVDEAALVEALRERRIAGAGLDVYEDEPVPAAGLTELPNAVCVCHIGSATEATRSKMSEMAAANLLAAMRGEVPPHPVNVPEMDRRRVL